MAAAEGIRLAPTYDFEGLPLVYPILFEPEQICLRGCLHHGEHPELAPMLQDNAGMTLRRSRCYWAPDIYHRSIDMSDGSSNPGSYHHFIGRGRRYVGPKIPGDESTKVIITGLYLSGVVPREALDFTARDPDSFAITTLSDRQYEFLSSGLVTTVERGLNERAAPHTRNRIGNFLVHYALQQEIGDLISREKWETFLCSDDETAAQEIGRRVVYRAMDEVARPIMPYYHMAQDRRMITSNGTDPDIALRNIVPEHKFGEYYQILREAAELVLAA